MSSIEEGKVTIKTINGVKLAHIATNSPNTAFGIAVLAGSNYETPEIAGISHFAEHMFFKGTETRDWRTINHDFARFGAQNNAYTSNDEVLYYSVCPSEKIEDVSCLMLDLFFNSTFPADEMEKERKVILEEKKMYEDDPDSSFYNLIGNSLFSWDKGHDTLGEFETINSITREQLVNYLDKMTNSGNLAIICVTNEPVEKIESILERFIPETHRFIGSGLLHAVSDDFWKDLPDTDSPIKVKAERPNMTQSHIAMLTRGLSVFDQCFSDMRVVNKVLGGGMYSMLFSRIREELGLCYHVGKVEYAIAYPHYVTDLLYGYTSPNQVDLFIEECEKLLQGVIKDGLDPDLFECAKVQSLSEIYIGQETSNGKMKTLIKRILQGKTDGTKEMIERVNRVSLESCNALIEKMFDQEHRWVVMNPEVEGDS